MAHSAQYRPRNIVNHPQRSQQSRQIIAPTPRANNPPLDQTEIAVGLVIIFPGSDYVGALLRMTVRGGGDSDAERGR